MISNLIKKAIKISRFDKRILLIKGKIDSIQSINNWDIVIKEFTMKILNHNLR